ncbi:DUF2156 domain-containing protein [Candidatus Saccharibacteria bacterium]|nr:DUF2156 domain-containing protein [Candidatus Saccharibacteria bacterium]
MTIADYPSFTKLTIDHKEIFDDFGRRHGHYCDFDFVDLFAWDIDSDVEVSMLNGNIVLKRREYLAGREYYSIFGVTRIDESLTELLTATKELELVPGVVVDSIKDLKKFNIVENRDSFDYIYDVDDIVNLNGTGYKKIRNKLNKFRREYGDIHKLKTVCSCSTDNEKSLSLRRVFEKWGSSRGLLSADTQRELSAFDRMMQYCNILGLFIVEVWLGDDLLAFSVNHVAEPGYAITHFEKVKKVHDYFSTYVVNEVAKQQKILGCDEVNWEDDLGFPGLRQSKSSYCPKKMLKKFNISLGKDQVI